MPRIHVIIIDGTLSRIKTGQETNAGLLFKLLRDIPGVTVGYDPGVQGKGLMKWVNVLTGHGINCSIRYGYTTLAKRFRPGDKIFLFGFSRGAYAVRSIAGMMAKVGLLKPDNVKASRVNTAFRLYKDCIDDKLSSRFRRKYAHPSIEIEMIGVWDTVKALGLHFPLLSYFAPMATEFHDHKLSPIIRNAYQALAADENRRAFASLPWQCQPNWRGHLEQAWFAGAHADVGGHVYEQPEARCVSNISLNWMLERAEACGIPLPDNWQSRFPTDPLGPILGPYAGSSKFFLFRESRQFGNPQVDILHPSLLTRINELHGYKTRLKGAPLTGRPSSSSLPEAPSG